MASICRFPFLRKPHMMERRAATAAAEPKTRETTSHPLRDTAQSEFSCHHYIKKLWLTPSQADFEAFFTRTRRQSHLNHNHGHTHPQKAFPSIFKLFLSASLKKLSI